MDTLQLLGSAMGLGLLAGIRLYATVFALGLAIRMNWFHLTSSMSQLDVIASTPVLAVSGLACLIEFFADKIPWIDSLWDAAHTFIRPIGAALLERPRWVTSSLNENVNCPALRRRGLRSLFEGCSAGSGKYQP
ncbi:MAG: DUF4126 domain-containing protein [Bryobacteraceae bacterium]